MVVPLHRRWKFLNLLAEELWLKWKTTYLQSLQMQSCWKTATDSIRKGNLVLLKDDLLATPHWPTAVVSEVFPGEDGLVRVVDVYCKGKTYRRPITKLSLLYSLPRPTSDDVAPSPTEKIRVMPPSIADDTSMPASLLSSSNSSSARSSRATCPLEDVRASTRTYKLRTYNVLFMHTPCTTQCPEQQSGGFELLIIHMLPSHYPLCIPALFFPSFFSCNCIKLIVLCNSVLLYFIKTKRLL